jgi:hypothetical protein
MNHPIEGLYEHYKGKTYRVHGLVRHSETLEELVSYECLYENDQGQCWVRPRAMFFEDVVIEGVPKPRFRYLGPDAVSQANPNR